MKRNSILALLLCVLFVTVGTGCSLQKPGSQPDVTKAQKTTKSAQIANPVKTYDSLAKAEKVAVSRSRSRKGSTWTARTMRSTTGAPSTTTSSKSAMAARAMKCATCVKPASARATRPAK